MIIYIDLPTVGGQEFTTVHGPESSEPVEFVSVTDAIVYAVSIIRRNPAYSKIFIAGQEFKLSK